MDELVQLGFYRRAFQLKVVNHVRNARVLVGHQSGSGFGAAWVSRTGVDAVVAVLVRRLPDQRVFVARLSVAELKTDDVVVFLPNDQVQIVIGKPAALRFSFFLKDPFYFLQHGLALDFDVSIRCLFPAAP